MSSADLTLGIDTAGPGDSVALVRDDQAVATFTSRQPAASSRPLLRLIHVLCGQAGVGLADVSALAVNVGPGAFTGLRVGLATAQGLALAYDKPLVGCTAFEALAGLVPYWHGALCPMIQARKGEIYAALYQCRGEARQEVRQGVALTPSALCDTIHECTLFLGSGATAYRAELVAALGPRAVCLDIAEAETGLAISVARLGARRLRTAGSGPLPVPQPLYIRPADARLPRIAANAAGVPPEGRAPEALGDVQVVLSGIGGQRMLEGVETALIDQASRDNEEFRQLLEAHQVYEERLKTFNDLTYLTSDQELERKRLQKLKLLGKDRMMAILSQYVSS